MKKIITWVAVVAIILSFLVPLMSFLFEGDTTNTINTVNTVNTETGTSSK